jgi:hypothetical protein
MLAGTALRHQMILPQQQYVYDYWRSKCRAGCLPSRADIDPSDICEHLPMITVTEACHVSERTRFKYRLAGTGFWELFEDEITGQYIDELPIGNRREYWHRVLNRVINLRRPSAGVTKPGTPMRGHLAQFWIRLPLSDDGVNVTSILGFDHLVKYSELEQYAAEPEKISA